MSDIRSFSRRGVLSAAAILGVGAGSASAATKDWGAQRTRTPRPPTTPAPTPTPTPTGPVIASALVGMSSPASVWTQRVGEVGPGLAARRIFADLGQGATSQLKLVEQAHRDGMLPVISYKVGGDIDGAIAGRFDAVAKQAAAQLAAFDLPTAVTFWHEPHGDMTPAQFAAGNKRVLPFFKQGQLRVGPILNGWLLDRKESTFATYCPDDLMSLWDWVGIDTYESGTPTAPGKYKPAPRIAATVSHLRKRGHAHRVAVGEYNGFSAETISATGEALMTNRDVWFGCIWNQTGNRGLALEGARLQAFRNTLADPRSAAARQTAG